MISACLMGVNCKYNSKNNYTKQLDIFLKEGEYMLICPEQLGGLSTPRKPCEIVGGSAGDVLDGKAKVLNENREDVTSNFIRGANEVLGIANKINAKKAILKSRSPSCGCGEVYNGNFEKKLIKGNGITTELLIRNNIIVLTEEEFLELNR